MDAYAAVAENDTIEQLGINYDMKKIRQHYPEIQAVLRRQITDSGHSYYPLKKELPPFEEKILELQERKKELLKEIMNTGEEVVSKLTWEEVLELLKI